jgi:hypothetical protein
MTRWTGLAAAFAASWLLAQPAAADPNLFGGPRSELLPEHDLGCIAASEIKNVYTPPDLFQAYSKCAVAGRYDDAMALRLFAGSYTYFDTLRVPDPSSHDAFSVLTQYYPPRSADFDKLREAGGKYKDTASPESLKFCADLKRLGPPAYYPTYMITHGLGAYMSNDRSIKSIDVQAAWKETVETYARCTARP